jgi:hypothetical protein
VPEIWSPELWHSDSRTGKIKKHRLANEDKLLEEEPTTIITEPEQSTYNLAPTALLPVEEEESEIEEDS